MQRTEVLLHRHVVQLSNHDFLGRTWYGWSIFPGDDVGLLSWMLDGSALIEPGIAKVLSSLIADGDTVIDVGAHIGTLAIPAARNVGSKGLVIAIEPLPRAADIIRRSSSINGMAQRVRVECCAAGATAGTARLHISDSLSLSSLLPINMESGTIEVKVCPLDDIVPANTTVSVVKIDAEAYEMQVWRGMQRILDDNPEVALIVEFGPSHLKRAGVTIREWFDAFLSRGHRAFEIEETSGRCRPLRTTGLESVFSLNVLLLKRSPREYPHLKLA
jgi:FkbM family methyltransferase